MIYITGDMHGDYSRFKKMPNIKKNDFLIVCGDFGFIWDGSKKENLMLKKIGKFKYKVLFVDGCHENYDLLNKYEVSDWNGGKAQVISGNLIHLMRGNVYNLGDTKIFAFGGGQSDDKSIRKEANTWWEEEVPTQQEIDFGKSNLNKNKNVVDYIVTHEPPATLKEFLRIDERHKSEMGTYFDTLRTECTFKKWFFGKCHTDKIVPPQYYAVFNDVIKLG